MSMGYEKSAGAIVYKWDGNCLRYLLVLEHAGHTGFPKGHIEGVETEEQTAMREIFEETGMHPRIRHDFRHVLTYPKGNNLKDNVYFLAEMGEENPIAMLSEVDGVFCVSLNKALEMLTHENSKCLLLEADQWLHLHPDE